MTAGNLKDGVLKDESYNLFSFAILSNSVELFTNTALKIFKVKYY